MKIEEAKKLALQFEKRGGLLPVVVQDFENKEILMLGYVNTEALATTIKKRLATFWSTSRKALWTKGETSGDYLEIKHILIDCDQDALIYQVEKKGSGACHTYNKQGQHRTSCFYRSLNLENESDLSFIEE